MWSDDAIWVQLKVNLHEKRSNPTVDWHLVETDDVAQRQNTNPATGLSSDEARRRTERFGANELREGKRRSSAQMLLDQFRDFMILVLIAAAVVSGIVGDMTDTVVILVIVALNAAIGFVQEYRAERAIAALKRLAAPTAQVLRNGSITQLPAKDLVPGDIVLLEAGCAVPADLRLFDAHALRVDEAALTGESQPVDKTTRALSRKDLPVADRQNMAYKGTLVTYGRGSGIAVATGMDTELGRIAELLGGVEEAKTPLQKRLAHFGARLSVAILGICFVIFAAGLLRGESVLLMLLTAVSLAVAAIPEALPAVVTVSLALGAVKMVNKNALIRRLPAVETLGSVTYICSDKTGTLTLNQMRVEQLQAGDELLDAAPMHPAPQPWETLLRALALNNDAAQDEDSQLLGDPTEIALLRAAEDAGYRKRQLVELSPRLAELPFDSERKRMSTLHRDDGQVVVYVKGAPEAVLSLCEHALVSEQVAPFDRDGAEMAAVRMTAAGYRVLAFAYRRLPQVPQPLTAESVEKELTFLGLVGLLDPPRPEAADAVLLCKSAGITPVIITGDHPDTAAVVAERLSISPDRTRQMTGTELERLSQAELSERVERTQVYARVMPEQKIRIVSALQDNGEFVAMTGDGVNDAPALKRADIGIAMGVTGTDVAKEAADMILLDDNFATIVSAVREGRRIFDNIRKFIKYTMTSNSGEIWTIFLAPFLGLPIPLLPIHILWINLVTDGLPGLALAVEPEEKGLMQRPPRPPDESIFAHGMWQHIVWAGLLMGIISVLTQVWAMGTGIEQWQTMVFTVLTLSQMGHALAVRSEHDSLFTQGLSSNLPLLGAVLLTFALQLATIYLPWFNIVFKTQPLSILELIVCVAASSLVFFAVEIEKALVRRGFLYRTPRPRR